MSTASRPRSGEGAWPLDLWPLAAGVLLLVALWGGPLPERAEGSFAAHMVMHMGVMVVAAPLLSLGLLRLLRLLPELPGVARLTIVAAFAEFVLVWGWHVPALHDAARRQIFMLVLEQGSFLFAGVLLWTSALAGGGREGGRQGHVAGVGGLLLTSMHMTLLGALLLFAGRPLYACGQLCSPLASMTPLQDQQAGGAIMLAVGGAAYLAGALFILASVLAERAPGSGEGAR